MPLDIFDEIELTSFDKLMISSEFGDFKRTFTDQIMKVMKKEIDEFKSEILSDLKKDSRSATDGMSCAPPTINTIALTRGSAGPAAALIHEPSE